MYKLGQKKTITNTENSKLLNRKRKRSQLDGELVYGTQKI